MNNDLFRVATEKRIYNMGSIELFKWTIIGYHIYMNTQGIQ